MTSKPRVRMHWRILSSMPQDLFFPVGLVLLVGSIACKVSAFPAGWNSFVRGQIAVAIVVAGSALIFCASAFVLLLQRPTTITHAVSPGVARFVAVTLTAVVLILAVCGSVQLVTSSVPVPSLLFGAIVGNVLLSVWNLVISNPLPQRRNAPASRAG